MWRKLRFAVLAGILCLACITNTQAVLSTNYVYDDLDRLIRVTYDDGTVITYTYDANGNRLTNGVTSASTVPGAPTGVTATGGNAQVTVSFTAPTSNGGSPITSYTVTSNPGGITQTGTASPITVTGLTNGTTYTFTVTATNAMGTGPASAPSNSVTPSSTVPGAPTGVTATGGNAQATVSFTAPASNGGSPITSYTVTSNPGNISQTGTASPITVTGLTNGTAYTFTVTATNAVGTSPASAPSNSVTPSTVPGGSNGRKRPGHRELHRPGLKRGKPNHVLHGEVKTRGHHADRNSEPHHGGGPQQRQGLHLHRERDQCGWYGPGFNSFQ